jgi:uncharacterized protein (DUF934 family)
MPYIKGGKQAADAFVRVGDEEPLPNAPALVSASRLAALLEQPAAFGHVLGVVWPNTRPVAELAPDLPRLSLVALVFPVFRDGRAYTQARQLREELGFKGEVRATGDVLRDQLLFMHRAGFDAYEIRKDADAAAFERALSEISVVYQPSSDGRPTAFMLRQRMTA